MEVQSSPSDTDIAGVRAAVQAGVQAAIAAGADRQYVFTGMWTAAIVSVLGSAPPKTLAAVMEDYAGTIGGLGSNAESPALLFDPDERSRSATIVSDTVLGYLEPIHDSFEEDGREAFGVILDVIFGILSEVWGPLHLRKNLALQAAAFREGVEAPVVPKEPEVQNRKPHQRTEALIPEGTPREDQHPLPVDIPSDADRSSKAPREDGFYRGPSRRVVDIIIEVTSWGNGGTGVFGVATSLGADDDFPEVREFSGHLHDDNTGRLTPLYACVEALRRIGPPAPDETVRVGINAAFIVSARGSGAGRPGEEGLWSDLEKAMVGRDIEWHIPGGGVGTDLGRRSNRLTHERTTQLAKAGVS